MGMDGADADGDVDDDVVITRAATIEQTWKWRVTHTTTERFRVDCINEEKTTRCTP